MMQAKYVKTVLGWYNVTVGGIKYNVDPATFTQIIGVTDDVSVGCGELTTWQVDEIKSVGRLVV